MALPFTDSFTGSNGSPLSASWTTNTGAFQINTNAVINVGSPPGGFSLAHCNSETFGNDQYAQGVVAAITGGAYIGVAVRVAASANTGYYLYSDASDACYLEVVVAGSVTTLHYSTTKFAVGDVIRLEVSGTTITPLKNGLAYPGIPAHTDSSISAGSAGLAGYGLSTSSRLDSFEGGNLGGAAFIAQIARPISQAVKRSAHW